MQGVPSVIGGNSYRAERPPGGGLYVCHRYKLTNWHMLEGSIGLAIGLTIAVWSLLKHFDKKFEYLEASLADRIEKHIDTRLNRVLELLRKEEQPKATDDELYEQALEIAKNNSGVTTSYLQRMLGIGYARAAHLMDKLNEDASLPSASL